MSSPVSRLRVLLVAVVVSLGSLAFASSAFAGDAVPGGKVCPPAAETPGCGLGSVFDPNTTNIPYLGVAGEQVRVVKCGDFPEGAFPEFLSEPTDWSGDPHHQPQLVTSSVHTLTAADGTTCFAAEYVSDKAGLAFIKLKIFSAGGPEITEHQFLVGWTRICGNTLTEVASPELGDPTGNGVFNPRSGVEVPITRGFGRLQNQLKLCLPMGSNFTGLFPGDNVTLPDDWVALANQFARDATPSRADDPGRWEIHDTQLTANDDIHVDNNTINPTTGTATCDGPNDPNTGQPIFRPFFGPDTVDNCLAPNAFVDPDTIAPVAACDVPGLTPTAGEVGSFSRVFGDLTTCPTVGPFDPQRPDETLLSDGQLNAGDAPLPAVRVDFEIAPPSGTGIDGVGILCGPGSGGSFTGGNCTAVDKHVVHSRNGLGTLNGHNLDSPFYAAYIPATAAPDPATTAGAYDSAASGVSGVNGANNFPAFLNTTNPYHYWDHTFDLSNFPPGGNVSRCNRFFGDRRVGPVGASTVAVYSDEHGEAQAWYDPGGFDGDGFFFDRVPGIVINADGGCDLQNVRTLGTSSISAIARYPYEPVTLPDVRSNAVAKTVGNLFNKSISCVNKGNVPDVARLCTVTALDIDGQPFGTVPGTDPARNEIVCFSIQDGSSVAIERGFTRVSDPRSGTNRTCGLLDNTGHLQVIVLSSVGRPVDLIADFTDQELFRDCFVDFTPGGAGNCIASGGTGGGTTSPPAGTTTGTSTAQTVVVPAHSTSHAKFKVAYSRIVRPVHHRRYLQLRVNGKSKRTVRVRIRIVDRKGRSRTVTRRVRTNRAVRLYGLPLTGAKRIKVTVLG